MVPFSPLLQYSTYSTALPYVGKGSGIGKGIFQSRFFLHMVSLSTLLLFLFLLLIVSGP